MQVINPNSTKEVKLDEATFKVGILPFGTRTEIESGAYFNNAKAETPEQIKSLIHQGYEFVRWGIKGHSGVRFEDGSEVSFKMDEALGCVSKETMEVYAATPGLLSKLSTMVTEFNYLRKDAVKN